MWNVSSAFLDKLNSTNPTSIYRQFIIGSTDLSNYVLEYPIIRREASTIIGNDFTVKLDNTTNYFNTVITSKEEYYNKTGAIKFGFQVSVDTLEAITLTKGIVSDIQFKDYTTSITFKDKLSFLQDKTTTRSIEPNVLFAYTAADWVWSILTTDVPTGAGLDSTLDEDNIDLDYTSWIYWRSDFLEDSFWWIDAPNAMSGYIPQGETPILSYLDMICKYTDSAIYVDQDDKLFFHRWRGVSSYSITLTDSTIKECTVRISNDDVLTRIYFQPGYKGSLIDPSSWEPMLTFTDTPALTTYGRKETTYSDQLVWVESGSTNAEYLANRLFFRRNSPIISATVKTPLVPLNGTLRDGVSLTFSPLSLSNMSFLLDSYTVDINRGEVTLELNQGINKHGFVLSDPTYGLLDASNIYLL